MSVKDFQLILDNAVLSDSDREKLKKDRGFTDDIIDKYSFKSCGPYLEKKSFFKNLPPELQNGINQYNILIPYYDPDGKLIHLRPHKFGFKGFNSHVYIPYHYIDTGLSTLVIAESEFKAIASCMLGVPAIGVPGISSFIGNKFGKFAELLLALSPKNIAICFDNEIKDNPKYPNFKPDFTKRYDVEFYAYLLCYKIQENVGINTRIAKLKDEWMHQGKADIDGILANDISPEQYKECIRHAQSYKKFRSGWKFPPVHMSFMERRIDKYFYSGPITESFKCYYKKTKDKEQRISNFTIKVLHTMFTDEGKAQRLCKLYSNYGDSKPIVITPEMMVSRQGFQRFAMEMGDYEFSGSDTDLRQIWKYVFMQQDGRGINQIEYYGHDKETGLWFFENGAYKDGEYYPIDKDTRIIWVNDNGYKVIFKVDEFDAPRLDDDKYDTVDLSKILKNLSGVLGENEARLVLGWGLGNFFLPDIWKKWGMYPFLFFHGRQAGGKSTIANWISAFFGFEQKGINFHNSSVVGLSRSAATMSCIPLWFEEYRNSDKDIGKKNNYLRSIYDQSTIVKGTKRENEIKTYKARSTLIISGEENPRDAALNSRCLLMSIYRGEDKQKMSNEYLWIQKHKGLFNTVGHWILTNKQELWPKIEKSIEDYISAMDEEIKAGSRNKIQMAIISGVCDVLFGECIDFDTFVGEKTEEMEYRVMSDQALHVFFDDLNNVEMLGKFGTNKFWGYHEDIKEGTRNFYLWFSYAYACWEQQYKGMRNDMPISKAALLDHLRREPYFVDHKNVWFDNTTKYCCILNADHKKFPEPFKMLVDNQKKGKDK